MIDLMCCLTAISFSVIVKLRKSKAWMSLELEK